MAQRRVPKSVFDYFDGGAESEITLAENCRAFREVSFRPSGAVALDECKLSTVVVGQQILGTVHTRSCWLQPTHASRRRDRRRKGCG
jgi:hypothetical protein